MPPKSLPAPVVDALALAVVESSDVPLVLLDGALEVIAASGSFCRSFHLDPATVVGRPLFALGGGEWDVPQLRSLLQATLSGSAAIDAYEMDLKLPGDAVRQVVLKAHTLDYGSRAARLMLAVSDVTEARLASRLKDDLIREKTILLRELQHRVANSLQIIASVLMQSARKVQSEESRTHLRDAHDRVMSIATLQHQLAVTGFGEVALRAYFNDLCRSIGASMIHDHDQIALAVDADDGVATANTSVSLGLIVTELVINALKHAFPGSRQGRISVTYRSGDLDWSLSVADDGVGMPTGAETPKAGLGTGIVEALAAQLRASLTLTDNQPGTKVTLVHTEPVAETAAGPSAV